MSLLLFLTGGEFFLLFFKDDLFGGRSHVVRRRWVRTYFYVFQGT